MNKEPECKASDSLFLHIIIFALFTPPSVQRRTSQGAERRTARRTAPHPFCKKPFGNVEKVIAYLGRYTHRVAISNNRILSLDNGRVSFCWRDYKDSNRMKVMSLSATEFIRRFFMHVLPSGFRKIRHYGLFASRDKVKRLTICRRLTHTRLKVPVTTSVLQKLDALLGKDWNSCPSCGIGHLCRDPPIAFL